MSGKKIIEGLNEAVIHAKDRDKTEAINQAVWLLEECIKELPQTSRLAEPIRRYILAVSNVGGIEE